MADRSCLAAASLHVIVGVSMAFPGLATACGDWFPWEVGRQYRYADPAGEEILITVVEVTEESAPQGAILRLEDPPPLLGERLEMFWHKTAEGDLYFSGWRKWSSYCEQPQENAYAPPICVLQVPPVLNARWGESCWVSSIDFCTMYGVSYGSNPTGGVLGIMDVSYSFGTRLTVWTDTDPQVLPGFDYWVEGIGPTRFYVLGEEYLLQGVGTVVAGEKSSWGGVKALYR